MGAASTTTRLPPCPKAPPWAHIPSTTYTMCATTGHLPLSACMQMQDAWQPACSHRRGLTPTTITVTLGDPDYRHWSRPHAPKPVMNVTPLMQARRTPARPRKHCGDRRPHVPLSAQRARFPTHPCTGHNSHGTAQHSAAPKGTLQFRSSAGTATTRRGRVGPHAHRHGCCSSQDMQIRWLLPAVGDASPVYTRADQPLRNHELPPHTRFGAAVHLQAEWLPP